MDIHERLQYLRKQLKLTTRAFGASINMSGGAITNMEKGQRNITGRTVKDICREYNVNPDWLMYGKDPMFMDVLEDLDINDDVRHLARQFTQLSEKDRELVKNMVDSLCEKIERKTADREENK